MDDERFQRIAIFGAGECGKHAIEYFGKDKVVCVIDNDKSKQGSKISEIPVRSLTQFMLEYDHCPVIIAVSKKYAADIKTQLETVGVKDYETFQKIWQRKIKKEIENRKDFIGVYHNALKWIEEHTLTEKIGKAIICHTDLPKGYPEVTGYYIPTLIRIGRKDLAVDYAKWLISIQKDDGSYYDTENISPYVFDTAQILKGLLAARRIFDDKSALDNAIIKACDWLIGQMQDDGRIITPDESTVSNTKMCSEAIHLYCLSPLIEAANVLNATEYEKAALKSKEYYLTHYEKDIKQWRILTHFYAYIMEALMDLGEVELARESMANVVARQNDNGMISAYHDVNWVCSTGLFQLALVLFRQGDAEHGNKAFEAAINLQNPSGGWYGSYALNPDLDEYNDYFPLSEISWAVKYFFDALYYKNVMDFNISSPQFLDKLDKTDGRYKLLLKNITAQFNNGGVCLKILDVGCSKGRYLKNLLEDAPQNEYYGIDVSEKVLELVNEPKIKLKKGSLTDIPYDNDTFDIVFTCEALEHVVDVEGGVRELARVTKPQGLIIIVDKSKSALGEMQITPWEQWFDETELTNIMKKYCCEVTVHTSVPYEDVKNSNLFSVWIGRVSVWFR